MPYKFHCCRLNRMKVSYKQKIGHGTKNAKPGAFVGHGCESWSRDFHLFVFNLAIEKMSQILIFFIRFIIFMRASPAHIF